MSADSLVRSASRDVTVGLALTVGPLAASVSVGNVAALALSLFVSWLARQPAAPGKTYGYLRWEILAALINGAALLLISVLIIWEAVHRMRAPEPVSTPMT